MTDGTSVITTVHFVGMAIFALLAVIGIIVGMRLKRGRVKAQREVDTHAAEAGVEPQDEPVDDAARTTTPPPVAPSPPPLADQPAPGTPATAESAPADDRPMADEPIAAVAPDGTTAAVAVEPQAAEASPGDRPLTDIKGLGPRVAARLAELGVERVGQLAALDAREAESLDAQLGPFSGRMARDRWLEQARLLTAGDREGFEATFGKL